VLFVDLVLCVIALLGGAETEGFELLVVSGVLDNNQSIIDSLNVVQMSGEGGGPDDLGFLHLASPLLINPFHAEVEQERCDVLFHASNTASGNDYYTIVLHGNATLEVESVELVVGLFQLLYSPIHSLLGFFVLIAVDFFQVHYSDFDAEFRIMDEREDCLVLVVHAHVRRDVVADWQFRHLSVSVLADRVGEVFARFRAADQHN
jgi:hypothetical protein